jgi:hypothetical protein
VTENAEAPQYRSEILEELLHRIVFHDHHREEIRRDGEVESPAPPAEAPQTPLM